MKPLTNVATITQPFVTSDVAEPAICEWCLKPATIRHLGTFYCVPCAFFFEVPGRTRAFFRHQELGL